VGRRAVVVDEPLGDPYAELYWELLAELYHHEFEREPFLVLRPKAIEAAEAVIVASPVLARTPDGVGRR